MVICTNRISLVSFSFFLHTQSPSTAFEFFFLLLPNLMFKWKWSHRLFLIIVPLFMIMCTNKIISSFICSVLAVNSFIDKQYKFEKCSFSNNGTFMGESTVQRVYYVNIVLSCRKFHPLCDAIHLGVITKRVNGSQLHGRFFPFSIPSIYICTANNWRHLL